MEKTSYDDIPYNCVPASRLQPDRLASVATLFGMTPPPVRTCRVLELGCANGSNVIAMGYALPQAQCTGIDLSARQIEQGEALLSLANLPNVTLKQMNIMDIDAGFGQFDYIIAHGIYSWVPEAVQDKLLAICKQNLAPDGVAYVSFNTRPGWNMRSTIRDMMLYHAQQFDDTQTQIEQMKALLKFLADAGKDDKTLHGLFYQKEFNIFKELPNEYLFHEFLEEYNQPVYFYEFAEHAGRHGLQYLGDTDVQTMFSEEVIPKGAGKLQNLSLNHREQYFDFINNRMFRHCLLCHQEIKLRRNVYPNMMKQFHIASQLRAVDDIDLFSNKPQKFEKADLGGVEEDAPLAKAALLYLSERWPQAVGFSELLQQACLRLNGRALPPAELEEQEQQLAEPLLKCYLGGVIEAFTCPPRCTIDLNPRPEVSALARVQISRGNFSVSSLRAGQLQLPPVYQDIVPFIDGRHDRAALIALLRDLTEKGVIVAQHKGQAVAREEVSDALLHDLLQGVLTTLARSALLVA